MYHPRVKFASSSEVKRRVTYGSISSSMSLKGIILKTFSNVRRKKKGRALCKFSSQANAFLFHLLSIQLNFCYVTKKALHCEHHLCAMSDET